MFRVLATVLSLHILPATIQAEEIWLDISSSTSHARPAIIAALKSLGDQRTIKVIFWDDHPRFTVTGTVSDVIGNLPPTQYGTQLGQVIKAKLSEVMCLRITIIIEGATSDTKSFEENLPKLVRNNRVTLLVIQSEQENLKWAIGYFSQKLTHSNYRVTDFSSTTLQGALKEKPPDGCTEKLF